MNTIWWTEKNIDQKHIQKTWVEQQKNKKIEKSERWSSVIFVHIFVQYISEWSPKEHFAEINTLCGANKFAVNWIVERWVQNIVSILLSRFVFFPVEKQFVKQ